MTIGLVSRRAAWLMVAVALIMVGATTGNGAAAQGVTTAVRIVAIDGQTGALSVVDGGSGEVVGRFTTPYGGFTAVYGSGGGRYFLVNHYEGDAVTIVDSGLRLIDHGDHRDLASSAPYVRATITTGNNPAHYWAHDNLIAVFNDGDGTVSLFDEAALETSADPVTFAVAQPDHASIVVIDDVLLVGYYNLGRVDAYTLDGALLQENVGACPGTHGEAKQGDIVIFACADGLLAISVTDAGLAAEKIPYPAAAAGATPVPSPEASPEAVAVDRVNLISYHDRSPVLVGDFPTGLTLIRPESGTIELLPLPAQPLWMSFSADGERIAVLTADGAVHVVDPVAGTVLWTTDATTPHASISQEDQTRLYPFIAATDEHVYVPDPLQGEIVELSLDSGKITQRIAVGGQPARVALVMARGVDH